MRRVSELADARLAQDARHRSAALNPEDVTRVRLVTRHAVVEAPLPRVAKGVSRHRLDAIMLAQAERCGAAVERGVTVRAVDARVARLADGTEMSADALFLATGKHDLRGLARPAEARGRDPTLGLRVRLAPAPALDRMIGDAIELHLFDRGYAGLVRQEDGSANLCMAVHRSRLNEAGDAAALLMALGREVPALGERLAHLDPAASIDAIANVPYGWRTDAAEAGLFRLGDQAGVIPSLAGEGMGIAVASGMRAAAAYAAGGGGAAPAFQRRLRRDLGRPIRTAGLVRAAAESPVASRLLLPLAARAPTLIQIIARWTRIAHPAVDASSPS